MNPTNKPQNQDNYYAYSNLYAESNNFQKLKEIAIDYRLCGRYGACVITLNQIWVNFRSWLNDGAGPTVAETKNYYILKQRISMLISRPSGRTRAERNEANQQYQRSLEMVEILLDTLQSIMAELGKTTGLSAGKKPLDYETEVDLQDAEIQAIAIKFEKDEITTKNKTAA